MPESDWDTVAEQEIESRRDNAAWCDGILVAEGISMSCMLPPHHDSHPHEAGHDDHVYQWDAPDGDYRVAGMLGGPHEDEDWRTVRRA